MKFELWYLLVGGLMLAVAFFDKHVRRLPITAAILYLAVGVMLGPYGFNAIAIDPIKKSALLERVTEVGVIISLFTAGLKLRSPLLEKRWQMPTRLAFLSMCITVGLLTLVGTALLNLPLGAAILLGAILAPTDPVLASDVQLERPNDRDRLRFALTGEAGLNDGTSFPFVMLGLGLLGLHKLGSAGTRWISIDLVWGVIGGLGVGALCGVLVGRYILHLRKSHEETFARDEFIALGLIGFAYGLALLGHAYGFLAVFAAGLGLRHTELHQGEPADPADLYVAGSLLTANEQLERLAEIALVLILGAMISTTHLAIECLWFAPLLFLVIRPAAVFVGTIGCKATGFQRALIAWFGIRGIGSLYYLMFAIQRGLPQPLAEKLTAITLTTVAISIVLHGLSVTPIMNIYNRRARASKAVREANPTNT